MQLVVGNLKDDEKASIFQNGAQAIPRINWPAYNWYAHVHFNDGMIAASIVLPPAVFQAEQTAESLTLLLLSPRALSRTSTGGPRLFTVLPGMGLPPASRRSVVLALRVSRYLSCLKSTIAAKLYSVYCASQRSLVATVHKPRCFLPLVCSSALSVGCWVRGADNKTLWHAIGDVTGTEGRGKNNDVKGHMYNGLTFWAPNVNIFRDPRWGRGQETPGEDPTMNGEYATQFVTGMQTDQSSGFIKASACLKHYAAYSEEAGRNSFPAQVTAQDMQDTYLPAFEAGVTKGNASGIMCSCESIPFVSLAAN
jgi:hypothetical protein